MGKERRSRDRVVPLMRMTQALHGAADSTPSRIATIMGSRRKTWSQLRTRVSRLAAGLRQLSVATGDRVAILSLNSDYYTEALLATWWAGAVVVPLNIRWSAEENAYSIKDAGAVALFVDQSFAPMLPTIRAGASELKHVVLMGEEALDCAFASMEALIASEHGVEDASRGDEELAGLYYTGGTTGHPKGVMLSHRALWYNALTFIPELQITRESVYLHAAPMFHLGDTAVSGSTTMIGATHVYIPSFAPKAVLDAIEAERVTHALLVPTMVGMLLNDPAFDPERFRSVEVLLYGASPMPEGTLRDALRKLPFVKFVQGYGQTELAPVISVLPPNYHVLEGERAGKLRSAGRAAAGCEIRIVDSDGAELPFGEIGEIVVSSPGAMHGYWKMPEQTDEVLKAGWVHTGDGGYMDEDGFVFIVDRIKDMIVSGGENVFSAEVESVISTHPAVAQVAVIGIPSEKWGEAVHAIVVPKEGAVVCEDDIVNHCRGQIANFKAPRSVSFRTEPLPLSGAGKVLKRVLRAPYWEGADRNVG